MTAPIWRQRWQALSAREQLWLRGGAVVLLLAVLWWVALAPALRVLREAPAQQALLDAQWQELQDLQAQARRLQQSPRMTQAEALMALKNATTEHLGANTQLQTVGDRCTVTLRDVSAPALARWLAQVRTQARAVPVQAQLQRSAANTAPAPPENKTGKAPGIQAPSEAGWSGTVVLSLPVS